MHHTNSDVVVRKVEVGGMENNAYVLEDASTRESLIVDGCFEADKILDLAEGTNVVGIVQTHGHFDHVQVLGELKTKLGVPVMAHPGDDYPVAVDRVLSDGDTIAFGNQSARVLHTPGHTPGGICLLVGGHLISGDTLFPGGPGNTDGDKERFATIIEAIQTKLFTLPDDTEVHPGHGADTTIGKEKPQLQEWIDRGW